MSNLLGNCSTHPKVEAVVTERIDGQPQGRFCKPCWDNYKYGMLRLRQLMPFKPTFHIKVRVGESPALAQPQPIFRPQPIIRQTQGPIKGGQDG